MDVDVPCERQRRRLYTRTDTRNGEECMGGRRSHGRMVAVACSGFGDPPPRSSVVVARENISWQVTQSGSD